MRVLKGIPGGAQAVHVDDAAHLIGQIAAVRIEAAARKADDYKVPDWNEPRLDGSYNETSTATLGASYIGSRGYLGAAYTEQTSRYGLAGHTHEYEGCHQAPPYNRFPA